MRASALWCILVLLLPAAWAQDPESGGPGTGAMEVLVTENQDNFTVLAPHYEALVLKPDGNLAGLWNDRGHRLLGADEGGVQGIVAAGSGMVQQHGGMPSTVTVHGDTVEVENAMFRQTYTFLEDRVQVRLDVDSSASPLAPVTVQAGSVLEPSREAALRFSRSAYEELGAYPTDFFTDASSGQTSLWTTALYTVEGHTYRPAMLEPIMDGHCTWETQKGQLMFTTNEDHAVASPLGAPKCWVQGPDDVEVAGAVIVPTMHQVMQSFGPAVAGDTIAFEVSINSVGYDVLELLYPISSRVTNGANTGFTSAKLVVPWDVPEGGYRLMMYAPGHWDTKFTHSYLWDFMGNHGTLVATPFTSADMGDGHQRDDWGYVEQIEIDELRHWVIRNHPIDLDRQVMSGLSLGGLNSILAAVNHPDAYHATIYYSGVYDFVRFWATPLGLASFPTDVEVTLCCGYPHENPYEYEIRNPRERIDQFSGGLFIVQGLADAVAPPDHAFELSLAVPGSEAHWAVGAHENNVFAGFRKEALAFVEAQPPRPAAMRDQVDVRVYGHPDFMPRHYERFDSPRNHTTEWMTVWVEDHAWTRVQARLTESGYQVAVDRPAEVALRLPPTCTYGCNVTLDGKQLEVDLHAFVDPGPGVRFHAGPGQTYAPSFEPLAGPDVPVVEVQDTSLPVLPVLMAIVAASLLARRRGGAM